MAVVLAQERVDDQQREHAAARSTISGMAGARVASEKVAVFI